MGGKKTFFGCGRVLTPSIYLLPQRCLGMLVALEEGDQLGSADGTHQHG